MQSSNLLKVIAVSASYPRTFRKNTRITGTPPLFTLHSQKVDSIQDIKNMVLGHIGHEDVAKEDMCRDLLFVNNDVGNQEFNSWLKNLDGQSFEFGNVMVFDRENQGWSYGAYSWAVSNFLNQYEYFIFTEDDVYVYGDNYLKKSIDTFHSYENCGFLSFQGTSLSTFSSSGPDVFHARGGVGLTSQKILKKIISVYGQMPYCKSGARNDYLSIIREGEVAFTNIIFRQGYSLNVLDLKNRIVHYDYDVRRGCEVDFIPSTVRECMYKLKHLLIKSLYFFLVFLGLQKTYRAIKSTVKNFLS